MTAAAGTVQQSRDVDYQIRQVEDGEVLVFSLQDGFFEEHVKEVAEAIGGVRHAKLIYDGPDRITGVKLLLRQKCQRREVQELFERRIRQRDLSLVVTR